ncbi:GAP family protein [Paeniglutamicibacter sp. NPDC012692]|uniref:GAP family protein n=1 Tax=Paeniglutamicibacter sp. NPDC012692 TaxID=3364388 RepID=UPI0036AAADA9
MIELAWDLVPVLLGVVASPLAVIALIAVLLSRNAKANGLMYLIGWSCAVVLAVFFAYWLLGRIDLKVKAEPADWVAVTRLVAGVLIGVGAVWTYRRSRVKIAVMAAASTPEEVIAAAPQLPGWLNSVETFTAPRSLALGLGIFLLNPINVSCAFVAALDIRLGGLQSPAPAVFLAAFIFLSIIPMGIPVYLVLTQGEKAAPVLAKIRTWIAKHNGTLSAVFLALIAFTQIQKGLASLPWI